MVSGRWLHFAAVPVSVALTHKTLDAVVAVLILVVPVPRATLLLGSLSRARAAA